MLEGQLVLGASSQVDPTGVDQIEQALVGYNQDLKLVRLLELAGTLDIANCAWLSPITDEGAVAMPVAHIGMAPWADIQRAISAANAIPGLFSDLRGSFPAPGVSDLVICPIGNRNAGRAALFLRQRNWHASVQARLVDTIERVRQLIHTVWVIRGEVANDTAPLPLVQLPIPPQADALVNQYPFGVVILDADQNVHLANLSARKLFEDADVFSMVGNRLVVANNSDAIRFQVALRAALLERGEEGARRSIAIGGPEGAPLLLSLARMSPGDQETRVCVFITQPCASADFNIQPLAEHFNLTPVEVRVVSQLVSGLSVQDAASALQLKVQTVRTYLKQIFQKTGTHRQVELMQLMQTGALPALN